MLKPLQVKVQCKIMQADIVEHILYIFVVMELLDFAMPCDVCLMSIHGRGKQNGQLYPMCATCLVLERFCERNSAVFLSGIESKSNLLEAFWKFLRQGTLQGCKM